MELPLPDGGEMAELFVRPPRSGNHARATTFWPPRSGQRGVDEKPSVNSGFIFQFFISEKVGTLRLCREPKIP